MDDAETLRILIVDDNPSIHDDFRKVLIEPSTDKSFDAVKEAAEFIYEICK